MRCSMTMHIKTNTPIDKVEERNGPVKTMENTKEELQELFKKVDKQTIGKRFSEDESPNEIQKHRIEKRTFV
jgi:hypothetical protein